MPRGRKPRPSAIKELRGNPGKRPANVREPAPGPISDLDVPLAIASRESPADVARALRRLPKKNAAGLNDLAIRMRTAAAAGKWREIAPRARALRVLSELDVHALIECCAAYGRMTTANLLVEKFGEVLAGPNGMYPNPYLQIRNQERKVYLSLLASFGMTPADRTRVSMIADSSGKIGVERRERK